VVRARRAVDSLVEVWITRSTFEVARVFCRRFNVALDIGAHIGDGARGYE